MTSGRRPRTADNLPKVKWHRHPAMLLSGRRLVIAALGFSAFLIVGAFLFEGDARAFWLGIGIFVLGWFFTAVLDNRSGTEQHTFRLMLNTRFDDTFIKSVRIVSTFLRTNKERPLPKDIVDRIHNATTEKDGSDDLMTRQSIGAVLNLYEIIAISVYYSDADEFLLREYFNGLVLSHFKALNPFIERWREGDREAFVYFEWLATRWQDNDEI